MSDQQQIPTPRTDAAWTEEALAQKGLALVPADFARQLERELATLGAVVTESQPWRGELAAMKIERDEAIGKLTKEHSIHNETILERNQLSGLPILIRAMFGYKPNDTIIDPFGLVHVCKSQCDALRQANERLEKERDFAVRDLARAYSSDDKIRREISSQRDSLAASEAKLRTALQDFYNHCVDMGWLNDDSDGVKEINEALSTPPSTALSEVIRAAQEPLVKALEKAAAALVIAGGEMEYDGNKCIYDAIELIRAALAANQEREQG